MRILVIGATGGTGRAAVRALLRRGHDVTAFSRHATELADPDGAAALTRVDGDATDASTVDGLVGEHDAVVVVLGISESPVGVRLRGPRRTSADVRSIGTRNVVAAMQRHGPTRLVVQTTYGVGPTRDRLPWLERQLFRILLAPQIADTARQEQVVRASGLEWVIAQPVTLTDDPAPGAASTSERGDTVAMKVSRVRVAEFLADAAEGRIAPGSTVALSGSAATSAGARPAA